MHLLATPEPLPKVERAGEPGAQSMTGAQAQRSMTEIYGVCGDIRSAFIALQEAVRTAEQFSEEPR